MTKQKTSKTNISQVFAALLVGVIAVPAATTGLLQSLGVSEITHSMVTQQAVEDRGRVRQTRRNYWRAVDIYNELRRIGIDGIYPPDINNLDSIEFYLDPSNFLASDLEVDEVVFGAAPEMISDAQAEYDALPERYRDLLDGYMLTKRCPGSLRQYHLSGFYTLCQQLLDETIEATMPMVLQRSAYLRGFNSVGFSPIRTLKNRLIMMEESLGIEGTAIRPQGTVGQRRPRLDYSQYHN